MPPLWVPYELFFVNVLQDRSYIYRDCSIISTKVKIGISYTLQTIKFIESSPPRMMLIFESFHRRRTVKKVHYLACAIEDQFVYSMERTEQLFWQILYKNADSVISESECAELTKLRKAADRFMIRKAYAVDLLRWRGHAIPPAHQLTPLPN